MFETLYKFDNNGKKRYWKTYVEEDEEHKVFMCTAYGQVGGKEILKRKEITICKSQKTLLDQAIFEAKSNYNEKLKDNYMTESTLTSTYSDSTLTQSQTQSINKNTTSASTSVLLFKPMLACEFNPEIPIRNVVMCQPKLDGVRMYTIYNEETNDIDMYSRNNTMYNHLTHIRELLKILYDELNTHQIIFDGELYSHGSVFAKISGLINRSKTALTQSDKDILQYHIYDCYLINERDLPFEKRYSHLKELFSFVVAKNPKLSKFLKLVQTKVASNNDEIISFQDECVFNGYEGSMIRENNKYEPNLRSKKLLKFKYTKDSEFEIVGGKKGDNDILIFELITPDTGIVFTCTSEGRVPDKQKQYIEFMKNPEYFIGQKYCVTYQSLDIKTKVPRFPVGKGIRKDV